METPLLGLSWIQTQQPGTARSSHTHAAAHRAPILRPVIFAANAKKIRETMLSTIRIIWDVKELLCLITCLVLWFGMVMYVLFNQYCRPPECDQSPYYGTIGLSFLSSFTILTTANFPDVMMSAYTYVSAAALFQAISQVSEELLHRTGCSPSPSCSSSSS